MLTSSLRAKLQPISLYWAALVEKALKWVRYSRLPCCFLQCCSAQYSEIADQAVWEARWTLKMSKYTFFSGPVGRAFSVPPDPLPHQTGYHTNLPRLSKSPRTATGNMFDAQPVMANVGQRLPTCNLGASRTIEHMDLEIVKTINASPSSHSTICNLRSQLTIIRLGSAVVDAWCCVLGLMASYAAAPNGHVLLLTRPNGC